MKSFIKKIIPKSAMSAYHYCLAKIAALYYGYPSQNLIVIGVTGTNGKTTTVQLIAQALQACGKKVGYISTAELYIGERYWLNDLKMTMPGRFKLQKFLKDMVRAGCEYAVIETSSQGIEQSRHIGINYDVAVFTNLTPEHIEAHGGFDNYKAAKGKFFEHCAKSKRKIIHGVRQDKILVVNLDDAYASYFLQFGADKKIGFAIGGKYDIHGVKEIRADAVATTSRGSTFEIHGQKIQLKMIGLHNVYNGLSALAVGQALGFDMARMSKGLLDAVVPGRMEFIDEGQNFYIVVDYAPEPEGLRNLYGAIKLFDKKNIIHVLGSCGGGRDSARRPIMGEIAGKNAQYVIVTNEDPYDDDPEEIIRQVFEGAIQTGKIENKNAFRISGRREAIRKALQLAQENDLVLVTGKGCEQAIVVANNKKIPWDDRAVMREELHSKLKVQS